MYFQPPKQRYLPNQVEISNAIRSLYVDTARWLQNMIVSEVLNLPNKDFVKERLDQVAYDASVLFTRYYGQEAANKMRQLYLAYFENVHDMIESYQNNDIADIEQHRAALYQIADEIAALLSRLNRYWDYETLRALSYVLVDDTTTQIQTLVSGDYPNDIRAYDEYVNQVYRISDELTYGILRQFQI